MAKYRVRVVLTVPTFYEIDVEGRNLADARVKARRAFEKARTSSDPGAWYGWEIHDAGEATGEPKTEVIEEL